MNISGSQRDNAYFLIKRNAESNFAEFVVAAARLPLVAQPPGAGIAFAK